MVSLGNDQLVETERGFIPAVRVDDTFLCKCGCRRLVNGKKQFYSHTCYGHYRKNLNLLPKTPTCQWCGKIIPEGDRYCSQECKKIDYYRKGWRNQVSCYNEQKLGGE